MPQIQVVTTTVPTVTDLAILRHNAGWGKDINGRRPPPPSNYKPRKNQDQKPAAFVSNEKEDKTHRDDGYTCLLSKIKQSNIPSHSTSWLVDSACTAHMTFNRSLFSNYKPMQSASVEMGTKAKKNVARYGDVVLTLVINGERKPCKLKSVLHVPDFGYSLLSVSKMTQNGLKVLFEDDKSEVKQNSKTVATANLVEKLYVLDIDHKTHSAMVASLQTWHARLAHVHSQGSASMVRNNVVSGTKLSTSDSHREHQAKSDRDYVNCTACVYGKATRSVIPGVRSNGRASQTLELIHSDVCGPLEVQSIRGARFYITFIDDHSNLSVVYPMRKKSESFHYYKMFANFSQTHTGNRIKVLRSGRGGEYLSAEFECNLNDSGTQHQLTAAYTPEQNIVSERLNRTLMNLVDEIATSSKGGKFSISTPRLVQSTH